MVSLLTAIWKTRSNNSLTCAVSRGFLARPIRVVFSSNSFEPDRGALLHTSPPLKSPALKLSFKPYITRQQLPAFSSHVH